MEKRDYAAVLKAIEGVSRVTDRESAMRQVVDALWDEVGAKGVSWIGFYLKVEGKDEMILGPRRDKPACSPIGLHGMCGKCWSEGRAVLVADVARLGANYIACDPKDRSEVVIPLFGRRGDCWGVLDADSYETGSFSEEDVLGLREVVCGAGLTERDGERGPTIVY